MARRDSIAAIGGVRDGSSARSFLYFSTMSKSGLLDCRFCMLESDLGRCLDCPVADTCQHLAGIHRRSAHQLAQLPEDSQACVID